jgi:hypothetical protein
MFNAEGDVFYFGRCCILLRKLIYFIADDDVWRVFNSVAYTINML